MMKIPFRRRVYGKLSYLKASDSWLLENLEPHVMIALKNIFRSVRKTQVCPFEIKDKQDLATDLLWFMERYPLEINQPCLRVLKKKSVSHLEIVSRREEILLPTYHATQHAGIKGIELYQSQKQAASFWDINPRYLLGDTQGLGKTLTAIAGLLQINKFPAAIVVENQIYLQWVQELERRTDLRVHAINSTSPYDLPEADVYVFRYTQLAGWVDVFSTSLFKAVVYDEIASLRRGLDSAKGRGAKVLSDNADYVLGMSGTPIYNYGAEIYHIVENFIRPGCLGSLSEFRREWCKEENVDLLKDPKALGSYLREIQVLLRRTRKDVFGVDKRPCIEVHDVGYDAQEADSFQDLMSKLAMSTLRVNGESKEQGFRASGEFSIRMRQLTGIVKARQVAAYARMLIESGEPVIIAAWHREVYEIYLRELRDLKPVMFTGSESTAEKERNKQAFINGDTNCLILSLRSGIGIDGFQHRCAYMIFGELDFSPQIHSQVLTRVDRPGQLRDVTAIFLVCQYGSDPIIQSILGVKREQSDGLLDPSGLIADLANDDFMLTEDEQISRTKMIARDYLLKRGLLPDPVGSNIEEHCAA